MSPRASGLSTVTEGKRGTTPLFTPASFVAGCVAGSVGQAIGHPLDTLKVYAQQKSPASHIPWRTLWRGCTGPIMLAGGLQALNLGLYENLRRAACLHVHPDQKCSPELTPLPVVGGAAASAGLGISLLTCPLSRIKVVQQLCGGSFIPTARSLYNDGSLYRGLGATALWETSRGIYMVAYVSYKRLITHQKAVDEPMPTPLWGRVFAGASANVTCWFIMYPVDVCRTIQQSSPIGAAHVHPPGMLTSMQDMMREGGLARLYRGFGFTLLRAGPVSGVLLPLFDVTLAALERLSVFHTDRKSVV